MNCHYISRVTEVWPSLILLSVNKGKESDTGAFVEVSQWSPDVVFVTETSS